MKGNKMSLKIKALGLGLLAAMAVSAIAVMSASATTPANSHFTAEPTEHHVIIKGAETAGPPHTLLFQKTNASGEPDGAAIKCTQATYHGTLSGLAATTTQSVSVRPHYTECSTGGVAPHDITIDVPAGCGTEVFQFTSGNPSTIHVNCAITITHPSTSGGFCRIVVPVQTTINSAPNTYTTVTEATKHALTLDIDVRNITGHFEEGLCVFLGTTHKFDMTGSVTVWGENTNGGRVGITHT